MSYQIQLASVATPAADLEVFPFLNKLRQEAGEQPPSALLKRFHDGLSALFPDAPWSEGHYAGDVGRLTVVRRRKAVVPHVLYLAGELGLTVVDNQSGEVHRPPTYQVVLEGPAPGVELGDAATRLAALMRKPVTEMLALLSGGRRTVVKKGVLRFQARQYAAALRERAGCHATLALEPGPVAHPEPPPPGPPPVPKAAAAPARAAGLTLEPVVERPAASSYASSQAMPPMARQEQAPPVVEDSPLKQRLFMLADGLRLLVFATALYLLAAYYLRTLAGAPKGLLALTVSLLAMAAIYRVGKGARSNILMRLIGMVLVLIPLANILVLFLSIRRGKIALREEGIGTGWFGADAGEISSLRGDGTGILPSTIVGLLAGLGVLGMIALGRQAADKEIDAMLGTHSQPCAMVGVWTSSKLGDAAYLLMDDEGRYTVVPAKGMGDKVRQEQGRWSVRKRTIVWEVPVRGMDGATTDQVQAFKITLDGRTITMADTELRWLGNLKSQRCGFN